MKSRCSIFTALLIVLTIFSVNAVKADTEQAIRILINENELKTDAEPMLIDGRILVPLRAIFEALEATVDWIPETRTIIGQKDNIEIVLQLDNKIAKVGDKEITLDVAATAINGRTLVPIRFIAESIHANVEWEQNTRTAIITTNVDTKENNSKDIVYSDMEASIENIVNTIKHLTTEPRVAGSTFEKEMSIFYADVFKSYGYEVELQEFPFKTLTVQEVVSINRNNAFDFNFAAFDGTGINVIAKKPANTSDNKDIFIIGAHYDSESVTNGVIDNATGVAAVMELANLLRSIPTDKEIRFILFSGEENFMYGSRYYVSKLEKDELERMININIDSIGEEGDLIPIIGTIDGKPNECTQLFDEYLINKSLEIKKGPPSDYLPFEYAGRPALTIAQYPSKLITNIDGMISGDKIERIDVQKIKKVIDMLYNIIITI